MTGKFADAVQTITSGITAWRSTGATCWTPLHMSFLANVYARLGQFDDAWRCIDEAMAASEASKESWCDADIHRIAGEIVLLSGDPDTAKAEAYFERALAIARKQQAKSFELRAATSMARLRRDQGKLVRPAIFSPRSMAGSQKASRPPISRKPRRCSTRWRSEAR